MNEKRKQAVLHLLRTNGLMSVTDLSEQLGVSIVTIRRDLTEMENLELIRRINGGAMLPIAQTAPAETSKDPYRQHKKAIAEAAVALIRPGDTIFIDSGSTNYQIAQLMSSLSDITVITNGLEIAYHLYRHQKNITTFVCGGTTGPMHPEAGIVGPLAEKLIAQFRANIAFIGTSGIDRKIGLTVPYLLAASIKTMMMENASQVVLVSDHSKFGKVHSAFVSPLSSIHHLITDKLAPADDIASLRSAGMQVTLV
ncbi:DeoR/GlpR family DNA-binding transcription regulator [Paenibacillus ginsengarvi]|uniref:DeoR/GlpR transcriptional regulator n=1 Tax=Paenibacillus ginsengarvi TaxID=400777 RepID=A0A3B0CHQ0_9BACL|nr:DeoR/GlpR family DNA-binding transcription regulator [Paenibacillus ginsengarvi]RKN84903.1 DeoR/GlpR transcriptional regulator [Paenibacillus ginsengarvi]